MWRISSRRGTATPPNFYLTSTNIQIPSASAAVSSVRTAVSQGQLAPTKLTSSPLHCSAVVIRKSRRGHIRGARKQGGVVVVSPCQGHGPLPLVVEEDCNRLSVTSYVDSDCDSHCAHLPSRRISSGRNIFSDTETTSATNTFVVNRQVGFTCTVSNTHHTNGSLMSPL